MEIRRGIKKKQLQIILSVTGIVWTLLVFANNAFSLQLHNCTKDKKRQRDHPNKSLFSETSMLYRINLGYSNSKIDKEHQKLQNSSTHKPHLGITARSSIYNHTSTLINFKWLLSLCRPLEKDMITHSNILAWRIPIDRGAWWATVRGVTKRRTLLSN